MRLRLLTLLLVLSQISSAQWRVGFKTGLNLAKWVDPTDLAPGASWTYKTGAIAGPFIAYSFLQDIAVQIELNYIQKGMHVSVPGTFEGDINMGLIEVPLLVRYDLLLDDIRIAPSAGIAYATLLSSRAVGTNLISHTQQDRDFSGPGAVRPNDFSGLVGLSVEYSLTPTIAVLAEGRFSRGLRTIAFDHTDTHKTQGIQIQAGVSISPQ